MIRDKYLRERGGKAKIIDVLCGKCGRRIMIYQKDGEGWLKRCYLNRILWPEKLTNLQKKYKDTNFPNLCCECGQLIGSPIKHKDGRLAFKIVRKSFMRSLNKENT